MRDLENPNSYILYTFTYEPQPKKKKNEIKIKEKWSNKEIYALFFFVWRFIIRVFAPNSFVLIINNNKNVRLAGTIWFLCLFPSLLLCYIVHYNSVWTLVMLGAHTFKCCMTGCNKVTHFNWVCRYHVLSW